MSALPLGGVDFVLGFYLQKLVLLNVNSPEVGLYISA